MSGISSLLVTSAFEALLNHKDLFPHGNRVGQVLALLGMEYSGDPQFRDAINLVIGKVSSLSGEPQPAQTPPAGIDHNLLAHALVNVMQQRGQIAAPQAEPDASPAG